MNTFLLIGLILLGLIFGGVVVVKAAAYSDIKYPVIHPDPLDVPRIIWAIKQVENWDGHTRGAAGEWGAMQMRPAIYARYHNDEVGYINELILECSRIPRKPTVYIVALLHGAGFPRVRSQRCGAAKFDYAARVQNVYDDR